ncbi:MAG: TIM barrel protein [Clostridia bacterium]|nr:TIM barrel protein [Clostridia bacterium]
MVKLGVADYGMLVWYGGHYDYDERIQAIRKIGYDGLERLYPDSAEDALRKAAQLRKLGMGFATCNAATPELSIKWTAALGASYVWAQVKGQSYEAYLRQVYEMTKAAEKYGVKIAVHNHLGSMAESQEQVETILHECPDTYLLLDTGHLAVAGGDVRYIAEKYYDRIAAYHLKGWKQSTTPDAEKWQDRGHFCGLGQGDFFIDNEFVFKNAIKNGFDGWVHIEHDTHEQDPHIDLKESFDILQKWRTEV